MSKHSPVKPPLWAWMLLTLFAIGLATSVGPQEKVLGANARIVYLHGVWVWAALAGFVLAGAAGLVGLLSHSAAWHAWSRALGRTGLVFWITYLPISMWAMQTSWNGLFLAEPRFRLAVIFSVTGLLLQVGAALLEAPAWTSWANLIYIVVLMIFLVNTQNVMHPPSPILNSDAPRIQTFFAVLFILALGLAAQLTLWWRLRDSPSR